jgi:hypothetical protein
MFIAGLLTLIGLTIQVSSAYALYSPRLSQQAGIIRQHIRESQAQNGTQSILEEYEQILAYDKARREAFEAGGTSGNVRVAQDLISNDTLGWQISHPLDSLFMVFNFNVQNGEWISTCLRDDIWSLETLRDMVGAEMIKAYMLRDTLHGDLLMEDYRYIVTQLNLLRIYGSNPTAEIRATRKTDEELVTMTSTQYFFGNSDNNANYYRDAAGWIANETGCPESEFQNAFKEVVNSAKTLSNTVGKNAMFSSEKWGSIWEMAKMNARARAKQWIRANQVSLTLGGEQGGRAESLVKANGVDKFWGEVKTQLQIAKNMVGPVTPLWSLVKWTATKTAEGLGIVSECVFYYKDEDVFRNCDDEQKAQYVKCNDSKTTEVEKKEIRCDRFVNTQESLSAATLLNRQTALQQKNADALEDVENTFVYSISMDSVAEQNVYFMDEILWDMNGNIRRGFENVDEQAGKSIPTLTRKVGALAAKQCANKQ